MQFFSNFNWTEPFLWLCKPITERFWEARCRGLHQGHTGEHGSAKAQKGQGRHEQQNRKKGQMQHACFSQARISPHAVAGLASSKHTGPTPMLWTYRMPLPLASNRSRAHSSVVPMQCSAYTASSSTGGDLVKPFVVFGVYLTCNALMYISPPVTVITLHPAVHLHGLR